MMKVRHSQIQPLAMGAIGLSLALLVGGCSSGGGGSSSSGGSSGGSSSSSKASSGGSSSGGSSSSSSSKSGGSSGGSSSSSKASSGGSSGGSSSSSSKSGGSTGGSSSSSSSGGSTGTGGKSSTGGSTGGSTGTGTGTGSGGSSGGSTGTGTGSGSTGGSTGSGGSAGGSTGAPGDLKCKDAVYGDVTIPQAAIISDFEDNSLKPYATDGRAAGEVEGWRAWGGDAFNPEKSPNTFKIDTSVHGPCSTKAALHITSVGPDTKDSYAAFGVDVMGRTSDKKKQSWDASKYSGVGFWAKCANDLPFAFLKVVDGNNDGDMPSATCSYSSSPRCVQHGVKNAVITKDWTYFKLYFSEALQDPNGNPDGAFTPATFDPKKFVAFQVNVNPFSPRSGTPSANKFDCYVDDVHFLSEPAPTTPTEDVSWKVDGTKFMRNGKEHKIRGLVRPSMEWDYSGFGVTREDAQRIKAWKANAVRLAVKDTLWKGADTGSTKGNAAMYPLLIKRAVNWYLQQGMDVILDLHYVGGSPSADNASWWDTISKDKFFQDGRIIFELYNEPTDSVDSLRTWSNGVISKIRGNGATKNLILVSGPDYTYDLSGYVKTGVTDSAGATGYAVHPYIFKPDPNSYKTACAQLPVVATEFGDAKVPEMGRDLSPTSCNADTYKNYIDAFEGIGMSWTSWAWIVDEWGCGFPQIIQDWSGTPNAIGKPVQDALKSKNP